MSGGQWLWTAGIGVVLLLLVAIVLFPRTCRSLLGLASDYAKHWRGRQG